MMGKTIRSTGVMILGKVVTIIISLFTIRMLTGRLGAEGYGNFTLITSIFLLFDAASDMGTRIIGVREMAQSKPEKHQEIWMNLFWLRLILVGIVFGAGVVFTISYSGFGLIRTEAMMALLMLWGTMVAGSLEVIWQYRLKLEVKTIIDILFPLLFLGWLWWPDKTISLLGVMVAFLVARWVSLAIGWITVRDFFAKIKVAVDIKLIKKLLKESWPMGLYLLIFTGYDKAVDSMFIRHYWGVDQVAWYGLAYKIYSSLIMPAYFFVSSVFPLLSRNEAQKEVFRKSRTILLLMVLVGAPFAYFLAPTAVDVLSRGEYVASIPVIRILIIALFFSYLNHLNGFWLISQGKQKLMLVLGIIVMLTNILGNFIFVPIMGINGGAWVTAGSEALMWVLMSWQIRKQ